MRNLIWYELIYSYQKFNFLTLYIQRQKNRAKFFKILTITLSLSGIIGAKFWTFYPIVALILITIFQIITLIIKEIVPSEKDIDTLTEVKNMYYDLFSNWENLFYRYENKTITDKETTNEIDTLNGENGHILKIENKVVIVPVKKLLKKAEKETHKYSIKFNH